MIRNMIILILFSTANTIESGLPVPGRNKFLKKLIQYVMEREMTYMFSKFGFRILVVDGSEEAAEFVNTISYHLPAKTVVMKLDARYTKVTFDPCVLFLLLNNENKMEEAIQLVQSSKMQLPNIPTVLVKLTQVQDDQDLDILSIMKKAWSMGLHRFLLIYGDDNFKALSYNPFKSSISDLSNKTSSELFPWYFDNLQKYVWKVGLFEEWPLNKKTDRWFGRDILLLKRVANYMNASLRIVEPPPDTGYNGSRIDILTKKADFCFVRRFFVGENNDSFRFINTGSFASLSVIVPKATYQTKHTSLRKVFGKSVWIFLISTIIIIMLIANISVKKNADYGILDVFLDIWRITFNIPLKYTAKEKDNTVNPLATWMLASLVLDASFQSRLIDLMNHPDYQRGIETLEDLELSNLPVYTSIDYVRMQGDHGYLRNQMHLVSYKQLLKILDDPNASSAVVLPFIVVRGKTSSDFLKYLNSRNKTLLSESLIKSYEVYTFPKFSPFINPINWAILRHTEHGLMDKVPIRLRVSINLDRDKESTFRLKMRHVSSAFHLIGIGLFLSFMIFVLELWTAKRKRCS